jgi:hypothetical protein
MPSYDVDVDLEYATLEAMTAERGYAHFDRLASRLPTTSCGRSRRGWR